jgi:hypothetical protein
VKSLALVAGQPSPHKLVCCAHAVPPPATVVAKISEFHKLLQDAGALGFQIGYGL